ncbi:MAG: mechanosensitive ion channel family protein [Clostridiaceae bacterium]|nr:mechanosensitive ion channel family protein [Clostridiaceae bacterium]
MAFLESIKDQVVGQQFLNRSVWAWIQVGVYIILLIIAFKLLSHLVKMGLQKKLIHSEGNVEKLNRPITIIVVLFFFAAVFSILIDTLEVTGKKELFLSRLSQSLTILAIALIFYYVLPAILQLWVQQPKTPKIKIQNRTLANFLYLLIKLLVILFAIFAVLSAWGVQVSGLLAGIGIGGLAISLAAQDTLSNFISGVTVLGDQPFEIGDFVKVGEVEGTVESIGLRSTKIRTLDTQLVILPNNKVVNDIVTNYSEMTMRRINLDIPISVETPADQTDNFIKKIYAWIELRELSVTKDMRVRINQVDAIRQNILIQYYLNTTNFELYMNEQEDVLLAARKFMTELDIKPANPLSSSVAETVVSKT